MAEDFVSWMMSMGQRKKRIIGSDTMQNNKMENENNMSATQGAVKIVPVDE